jgi:hypothetical protein
VNIVVHQPTVEAPESARRVAAVVLAALLTDLHDLIDAERNAHEEPSRSATDETEHRTASGQPKNSP